jgi:anti-anti-sigma regulatory factor
MTMVLGWVMDGEHVLRSLEQVGEKLDGADHEVVLDFSPVRRIDPGALRALDKLAGNADAKAVKIILRGVSVSVYKVLKLARLTERFAFLP